MGYFPSVKKGDKVQLSAEFHNAVVRIVNSVVGRNGRGGNGLSRTRVTIPVEAIEDIEAGCLVEFVGETDYSDDSRPFGVVRATSTMGAVGVLRETLAAGEVGSAVVFGLCSIAISPSGEEESLYVKLAMEDGNAVFAYSSSPTPYRLMDYSEDGSVSGGGSGSESGSGVGSGGMGHIIWRPSAASENGYDGYFAVFPDANDSTKFRVRGGTALVNGFEAVVETQSFPWPQTDSNLWLYGYIRVEESEQGQQMFSAGAELVFEGESGSESGSGSGSGSETGSDSGSGTRSRGLGGSESGSGGGSGSESGEIGPSATGILVQSRKLIATIYANKAWHQEFITGSECNFILLGDACE